MDNSLNFYTWKDPSLWQPNWEDESTEEIWEELEKMTN